MILVWICFAIMMCLQKVVRKETSLNGFVDLYLRSVFFFIFSCLDFARHVMTTSPTLSLFDLDHCVRWTYMFKLSFLTLAFGFTTLSVNNAGCITLTAAPFMLPAILTVTERIPRIVWLLIVVMSFVSLGFVCQGESFTPPNGELGLTIKNYTAFYQGLAAVLCFTIGSLISSRSEKLLTYRMHYAIDAVYISLLLTLCMPAFFFGDFSLNKGPLAISW